MPKEHASDSSKCSKRVTQACTRCKIKKVKCCGSTPCSRCKVDDVVCFYGVRGGNDKRMVSRTHVDRLQFQQRILMKALLAMWRKYEQAPQGDGTADEPSIHEIVASTGVLEDNMTFQPTFQPWNVDYEDETSSKSSPALHQDEAPELRHSSLSDDSITSWSPMSAPDPELGLADLDIADPNSNMWLDEFVSFAASADQNFMADISMQDLAEVPPTMSLAERRGATWLSKCQLPPPKLGAAFSNLDSLLTQHQSRA